MDCRIKSAEGLLNKAKKQRTSARRRIKSGNDDVKTGAGNERTRAGLCR
jgi:hypothetical protein